MECVNSQSTCENRTIIPLVHPIHHKLSARSVSDQARFINGKSEENWHKFDPNTLFAYFGGENRTVFAARSFKMGDFSSEMSYVLPQLDL